MGKDPLVLTSSIVIVGISNKTSAKFWKDVNPEDIIKCEFIVFNYYEGESAKVKLIKNDGTEHETTAQSLKKHLLWNFEYLNLK